jgi:hypothetical protein
VIFVVGVGFIVTVSTIKLSHPNDVVNVSLKVPAVVIVLPLKDIELPLHIACDIFVVGVGLIITVNTIKLSHPNDVVNVSLNVPALVIVFPLNAMDDPLQIDCDMFVVGSGLIETVNTIKLSQPNDVDNVSLKVPAVEIVLPLNTMDDPLQID